MHQSKFDPLANFTPILDSLHLPELFTPLDHNQEHTADSQAYKCRTDETILISKILQPRSDAVPDSKGHRVPNHYARRQSITRYVAVGVDHVRHGERYTHCIRERGRPHRKHQSKPVNFVRGAHAPEDQGRRDHERRHGEQPQPVFRLRDALVLPGEADDEVIREYTCKE